MGETEDLVKNTSGTVEISVNYSAGSKNPMNDDASSAENPVNKEAAGAENPVNKEAADAENPANDILDGAVNPVNVHAVGAESSVNNQSNGAENPANDKLDGVVNPVNVHAGDAEIAVSDQSDNEVNLIKDQTSGAENPSSDQSDYVVNLIKEQPGGAENPTKDHTGDVENLVKEQEDVKSLIKDQVGGLEDPSIGQVSDAENPINHIEDEAGNSAEGKADSYKKAITNTICDSENSAQVKEVVVEDVVDDKACGVENPVNDKAGAVENPFDKQENATETPVNKADHLPQEAKEILKSLASQWEDVLDANALQVIPLKGAMTNVVFQIKWATTAGETSRKVLVRIYGEGVEIFFDRDDEIRTFEFMSKHGQGPRLLGRFSNGRVEEFIRARTLSASDLRDPSISALIAAKMKEFHELEMPGEKKVYLWDRLRNWLAEAKRLSSPKEVEAFYLDTIDKEISLLEKELSSADQRIGFCHNDLQYGNIMLDEEMNAVTIIDYEYASYNPVAYDIANHFCEMTANYHTETPHILDFSKYPDLDERKRFLQAYLSSSDAQPEDSEVEQLLQEIEKYTLANHLFWGVWGIISAQVNKIDFDYKEYAKQRFQEYWTRKPYLLSYDAPSPYNAPEGSGDLATASTTTAAATKATGKNTIFRKMKRVLGLSLFRSKN